VLRLVSHEDWHNPDKTATDAVHFIHRILRAGTEAALGPPGGLVLRTS
jgi:hypothetical protein